MTMDDDDELTSLCSGCHTRLPAGTPHTLARVSWMGLREYDVPLCRACSPDGATVIVEATKESPRQLSLF